MPCTYLTRHFTLEELIRLPVRASLLDNRPDQDGVANLLMLACKLEEIRALLGGQPIHIVSAYRSVETNQAVGGVKNSSHLYGLAADFCLPAFSNMLDAYHKIAASPVAFDQLIFDHEQLPWIHLGIGAQMRRQVILYNT